MFFVLAETNEIVGWVDSILSVLAILTAILMTFFILLQEGKGGGLAALGGTKAAGVEGVTNPIRRATGYLAAMFFVMVIILGIMHKPTQSMLGDLPSSSSDKSATEEKQDKAVEAPPPGTAEPVSVPATTSKPDEKAPAKVEAPPKADEKAAPKADEKAAAPAPKADEKADAAKSTDAKAADAKAAEPKKADAPKQDEPKKTENK